MRATEASTRTIHLELSGAEAQTLANVLWAICWNPSIEGQFAGDLYHELQDLGFEVSRYRNPDDGYTAFPVGSAGSA